MDPLQILTFQKWHKTNGVNFRTPLSGARGIGHDVSHLNTGGGCAWTLPFPPTLPVAFPLGPATVPVSPPTKISNLDGICVWVCGRANVFLTALLRIYNSTSEDGAVADCWRTTCFHTLPKTLRALQESYFTPIANLRTVFAYLIPGPMEHTLDTNQLEEQLGFSSKYRVEEHLLAANLFPYEATTQGIPVWFESLAVSKAFECLWPCALAFSLTCIACWGHFGSHGVDAVGTVRGPTTISSWQVGIQPQFPHTFWRVIRVCPKSSFIFRNAAVGHAKLEAPRFFERNWSREWPLRCWICVLPTTSYYLQNHMVKLFRSYMILSLHCRQLAWYSMRTKRHSRQTNHNHLQLPSGEGIAILIYFGA